MIHEIRLRGFKAFRDTATVEVRDLMVLAGSNSCGKSSFMQALLLLAQTLEARPSTVALDLGGRFVQFAEFRDMVYGRPPSTKAEFSIAFVVDVEEVDYLRAAESKSLLLPRTAQRSSLPTHSIRYDFDITFGAHNDGVPYVRRAVLKKSKHDVVLLTHTLEMLRTNYRVSIEVPRLPGPRLIQPSEILEQVRELGEVRRGSEGKGVPSRSALPLINQIVSPYGVPIDQMRELGGEVFDILSTVRLPIGSSAADEQLYVVATAILNFFRQTGANGELVAPIEFEHFLPAGEIPYRPGYVSPEAGYASVVDDAFSQGLDEVRAFLSDIQYIGPLRAKPERAYLSTGTPLEIGNAGENAVPILWKEQAQVVRSKTRPGAPAEEKRLVDAVLDWFREFGIASTLHVTKPKRVIYQVELDSSPGSETLVTIADAGFGVSQLLPVLVAGLRSAEGTTLMFEQPEIHLHPRLQSKLADFFLCMVELGKRVVVETHSEHLVNSLRLRTAQDLSSSLQEHISILFVQAVRGDAAGANAEEPAGSKIEQLHVDEYGSIDNWPPDFFPEYSRLNEDLLTAMMTKHLESQR